MGEVFAGLLPCVKIIRNDAEGRASLIGSLSTRGSGSVSANCRDILSRATKVLKPLWVNHLCSVESRHSVANAIGPLILEDVLIAQGFGPPGPSRDIKEQVCPDSFIRLLSSLGLLRRETGGGRKANPKALLGGLLDETFVKSNHFGQFSKLRFLLVDDQAHAGFHDILARFLLGLGDTSGDVAQGFKSDRSTEGRFALSSVIDPKVLLNWLNRAAAHRPAKWFRSRLIGKSSGSSAADEELPEFDILFLDLRLHGIDGSTPSRAQEQDWLRQLIAFFRSNERHILHKEFGVGDDAKRSVEAAIRAAELYVDRSDGEVASFGHLALLPILLSVCDPTVPIILFSSTQQRNILELLKPFPNVITDFSKPGFSGYVQDDIEILNSSPQRLSAGLQSALELHEKRLLWELTTDFVLHSEIEPDADISAPGRVGAIPPPFLLWEDGVDSPHNHDTETLGFSRSNALEYRVFDCVLITFSIAGIMTFCPFHPRFLRPLSSKISRIMSVKMAFGNRKGL